MESPKLNAKNKKALTAGVIVALIAGFLLLRPFFAIIMIAIIAAFTFYPVYSFFQKKLKKDSTAASITLVVSLLAVIIPTVLISIITIAQLKTFSNDVLRLVQDVDFSTLQSDVINQINKFLENIPFVTTQIDSSKISSSLTSAATNISSFLIDQLSSYVGSVAKIFTSIILYMYIFLAVLIHHKALVKTFKKLNPLGDDVSNIYLQQASAMTKGMVRGQFIIAAAQGVASAAILAIAGIDYFAFFALILTVFSIIPLGAGIITLPIGFILVLTGNMWAGLLVILGHLLIVTNIDNILRPHLVPKNAKLDPALTILSVFAGIGAFGLLGVIVGPVIMILIVTTIKIYANATSD